MNRTFASTGSVPRTVLNAGSAPQSRTALQAVIAATVCAVMILGVGAAEAKAASQATALPGHKMKLQRNDHALGISAGYGGTSGFAYRKYLGNSFLQFNILPLVADRGDFLAVMLGATAGRYLIVWNRRRGPGLMPSTTALRAVGTVSTYFTRDSPSNFETITTPCSGINCAQDSKTTPEADVENITTVAAGIGFEFGAILRNGFSMSVDVLLTSAWDEKGFTMVLPLPYAAVMYNW